jgi:glycosyltransferase involved in cell wall biosynthesis
MGRLIVHVAEIEIGKTGGMARIAHHWQEAFERKGDEFVHIGLRAAGRIAHRTMFPEAAYRTYQRLGRRADVFLVHEPAAGSFVTRGVPTFVFSHGIERRYAGLRVPADGPGSLPRRLRGLLAAPLWNLRKRSCDRGLRGATAALLCNREDEAYAKSCYGLPPERIWLFRNGVNPVSMSPATGMEEGCRILFLGSWINRKGIASLGAAAAKLQQRGVSVRWLLAGTGVDRDSVLARWPVELREVTTVIPQFGEAEESGLYASSDVFVLPSLFEGQPLALLQAMASGLACVASDCCGQRDLIQSGWNGWLHEPGNVDALAAVLETAATHPSLRRELGQRAKHAMEGRTWEVVSDEVADFVDSTLNRG